MPSGYFHRVAEKSPTRFWLNNPTRKDMEQAIAAGAINVTTNPAYCSKLIKREPGYIRAVIDRVVKETQDDDIAADATYQKCASRVMDRFLPVYKQSRGSRGYVTIQADPREDKDPEAIVNAALRHQALGKNYMAKVPVIPAGAEAIAALVEADIPICATEVFSVSQATYICDLYRRVAKKCGKRPPFFVTHITGIFDEYLLKIVKRDSIDIAPELLWHAGCAVARKEYQILRERGYETTMLGGGARGTHHFTEFVGGDVHITINWSTARELIEADGPVVSRIDAETPKDVIDELVTKLPDFSRAYHEEGLSLDRFEDFGPVQMFRNNFLQGYYLLMAEVASRRALHP